MLLFSPFSITLLSNSFAPQATVQSGGETDQRRGDHPGPAAPDGRQGQHSTTGQRGGQREYKVSPKNGDYSC